MIESSVIIYLFKVIFTKVWLSRLTVTKRWVDSRFLFLSSWLIRQFGFTVIYKFVSETPVNPLAMPVDEERLMASTDLKTGTKGDLILERGLWSEYIYIYLNSI